MQTAKFAIVASIMVLSLGIGASVAFAQKKVPGKAAAAKSTAQDNAPKQRAFGAGLVLQRAVGLCEIEIKPAQFETLTSKLLRLATEANITTQDIDDINAAVDSDVKGSCPYYKNNFDKLIALVVAETPPDQWPSTVKKEPTGAGWELSHNNKGFCQVLREEPGGRLIGVGMPPDNVVMVFVDSTWNFVGGKELTLPLLIDDKTIVPEAPLSVADKTTLAGKFVPEFLDYLERGKQLKIASLEHATFDLAGIEDAVKRLRACKPEAPAAGK